ncbi:glucosamine-6-phosphate deaminase [Salegentibacter salegens]|uniref:Glucosamine-6-phosphate deaminase n=1 Tax=Salegentibacter salegens TaxID=143223 RepID=A0A1M7MFC2_9FLAO|nr:glucosamine-6-phosphate deaminase [Salegentibacter salegens]PRX51636.1 glucosamine-6-phosphate deaminase [Salegentibacter salegens]SHM89063.1 glucosamine-6-phosphate deaminase [Salegentibacter salegens]
MKTDTFSKLNINIYPTKELVGKSAGRDIVNEIKKIQKQKQKVRIIFAAAPSQNETLEYLVNSDEIDWENVTAFNMDEYLGLSPEAPQHFSKYLKEHLFSKVKVGELHLINNQAQEQELLNFEDKITRKPIDIVCLGIGENGHIAFNDPPVADFNDSKVIKIVQLDDVCRQQQVNDKCFEKLEDVPAKAVTLTIPTLMKGKKLFCIATGKKKADAVYHTLTKRIDESCPATILRSHPSCSFYFDNSAVEQIELQESLKKNS